MIGFIVLLLAMVGSVVWLWAGGIEYMTKNHPDYKGEDWLNWDDKDNELKNNIM